MILGAVLDCLDERKNYGNFGFCQCYSLYATGLKRDSLF